MQRLPPRLAQLAEKLKEHSLAEAARQLGTPRSTLQGWVRQLRERFEQAELQHYLNIPPSTRPPTG
jgi:transposase-like protein